MAEFQIAQHFKSESSSREHSPWSIVQDRPTALPSISQWYDGIADTRRASTSSFGSSASSTTDLLDQIRRLCQMDGQVGSSASSATDLLDQIRRLCQMDGQVRSSASSATDLLEQICRLSQIDGRLSYTPYPSPGSSPGPEEFIVEKSKSKARSRSTRGVAAAQDREEAKAQVKANREKGARLEQSWSYSRAWQGLLKINPNMLQEGVTKDGVRGLRPLKRNNINGNIERAGHIPNQINKDQLVDLLRIIVAQLHELHCQQIQQHRLAGRHREANELEVALRRVGTYL